MPASHGTPRLLSLGQDAITEGLTAILERIGRMTYYQRLFKEGVARCSQCDQDLRVKPANDPSKDEAFIYCTSRGCRYFNSPHPTGKNPNRGQAKV